MKIIALICSNNVTSTTTELTELTAQSISKNEKCKIFDIL